MQSKALLLDCLQDYMKCMNLAHHMNGIAVPKALQKVRFFHRQQQELGIPTTQLRRMRDSCSRALGKHIVIMLQVPP